MIIHNNTIDFDRVELTGEKALFMVSPCPTQAVNTDADGAAARD